MRMNLPCLPLIQERFWNAVKDKPAYDKVKYPEFEFRMFSQTWGDTSLGFGGIGGQAITTAYTVVVLDLCTGWCGVFFGERLAYVVLNPTRDFWEDLNNNDMKSSRDNWVYYRKNGSNIEPIIKDIQGECM